MTVGHNQTPMTTQATSSILQCRMKASTSLFTVNFEGFSVLREMMTEGPEMKVDYGSTTWVLMIGFVTNLGQ